MPLPYERDCSEMLGLLVSETTDISEQFLTGEYPTHETGKGYFSLGCRRVRSFRWRVIESPGRI
jgi:hypothetical protein